MRNYEARPQPAGSAPPDCAGSGMQRALTRVWHEARQGWRLLRELSGDDAYERYLAHMARFHPGERPLSRAEHFRMRQEQKWNRVSRCC